MLFVALLIIVATTKVKALRIFAILGLSAYVVLPIVYSIDAHRIRPKNESWTLFTNERQQIEQQIWPTFRSLCEKVEALNIESKIDVTGFKILDIKPLSYSNAQARGWDSGIDFYAGEIIEKNTFVSLPIIENLKKTLPKYIKTGFIEYKNKNGLWERFYLDTNKNSEQEKNTSASHGIVFEQIFTGYEKKYTIFQVSISVYDLQNNKLVARNVGLMHDVYWGAHNNHQLLTLHGDENYCKRVPDNFVAYWLSSLANQDKS